MVTKLPLNHVTIKPTLSVNFYSMDLHPSREMVASGQRAGRNRKTQAHIRIWSTETLQTLYVFGMGEFEVGVAAVAFSQLVSFLFVFHVHDSLQFFCCRMVVVMFWRWTGAEKAFFLCGNGSGDIF